VAVAVSARRRRPPPAGVAPSGAGPVSTRRDVMGAGLVALFVAALAGLVSSAVAFLWPTLTGRNGLRVSVGTPEDLRRRLADGRPYYDPAGQFYLVSYPPAALGAARAVYPPGVLSGLEAGFAAMSARCTHLGCHVPFCDSSGWFECPCHGSRFDGVGEQRRGPAPRGLDHHPVSVEGGQVVVDTRVVLRGPPPGTDTTHRPAAGPHCR